MLGQSSLLQAIPNANSPRFAALLSVLYQASTQILLLNLLIAMFANTFERVEGEAEGQAMLARARGILLIDSLTAPFRPFLEYEGVLARPSARTGLPSRYLLFEVKDGADEERSADELEAPAPSTSTSAPRSTLACSSSTRTRPGAPRSSSSSSLVMRRPRGQLQPQGPPLPQSELEGARGVGSEAQPSTGPVIPLDSS
eukprot:tig00000254_g22591.t1